MRTERARRAGQMPGWWEGSPLADQREPDSPEPEDAGGLAAYLNKQCWEIWLPGLGPWHKEVEESVRMLSGRHWDQYLDTLGDFLDLSTLIPDDRWRQYPTFNWLAHYYKMHLSKLTENLPSIGFVPGSADWDDARLAALMEPVWKHEWRQMGMAELMFGLYGWVIVAGRGLTKLRWDPDRGPVEEYRGSAVLELLGADNTITQRQLSNAPFVQGHDPGSWEPALVRDDQGQIVLDDDGQPQFGRGFSTRLGDLACDVLIPISVVVPAGPEPFDQKPWYTQEYLLDVDEVERRTGVRVEPDALDTGDDLFLSLAYGANYGMPSNFLRASGMSLPDRQALKGLKRIREHWRRDIPGDPLLHRGRLTLVTKEGVVYDDVNPFWVEGEHEQTVLPFDAFDAVRYPWRQEGTSDLEVIKPLNRALNRRYAGMQDAIEFNEQPTTVWNRAIITEQDLEKVNLPGAQILGDLNPALGPIADRLDSVDLPRGSAELADRLMNFMQLFGSQPLASEGQPATEDASGELQREVRYDTDRVWGATLRAHSYVWPRIAIKMQHILAVCMEDYRLVTLGGEDNAVTFLELGREMFHGAVDAVPQPESQVLESRQDKQNRVLLLLKAGIIETPQQAAAVLNYPDLTRALRPGGQAYALQERETLELILGQDPPVLAEHDHAAHLACLGTFFQTPFARELDEVTLERIRMHKWMHEQMQVAETIRVGQLAGIVAGALTPPGATARGGAPGDGTGPAGPGSPGPYERGGAPTGAELQRGAATPGAADPRRAGVRLAS